MVEEPVKPANIEALNANPSMSTDAARKLLSSVVNPQSKYANIYACCTSTFKIDLFL